MAIYYQNFETFAVGATPPFGSFTSGNAVIVADNYLTTGSRACQTQDHLTTVTYGGSLLTSASLYVAFKISEGNNSALVTFQNGTSNFNNLFSIHTEFDQSISLYKDNGTFFQNSGDFSISQSKWSWLQANTTYLDVVVGTGTGTHVLAIAYEVAIDGTSIMSGTTTTGKLISSINSGTPQFDHIQLSNNTTWDEFTVDTLGAINTYPNPGTPAARASTGIVETLQLVDSAAIRATTGLIELLIQDKNKRVQES